jgi:hypothetical protein
MTDQVQQFAEFKRYMVELLAEAFELDDMEVMDTSLTSAAFGFTSPEGLPISVAVNVTGKM